MKLLMISLSLLFVSTAYGNGNCEAYLTSGSHTAQSIHEAMTGALEEAKDTCYPGDAEVMDSKCDAEIDQSKSNTLVRCTQSVSCTICGNDLQRRYEALSQ